MGLFSKKETPAKRGADEMAQPDGNAAGPSSAPAVSSPPGPAPGGNAPTHSGTVVDASEEPIKDILLQVPLAELHKVGAVLLLCRSVGSRVLTVRKHHGHGVQYCCPSITVSNCWCACFAQVEGNVESLLEKGSLVAYGVTFPNTGASMMALEMNETRWWLRPDMATLKVGLCTYMLDVTQPGTQQPTFFCVTFADDTLPEVCLPHYITA
jgi:hypothetical protein